MAEVATKDIDPVQRILDANARWAANPHASDEFEFYDPQIPQQHPHILWIGCADSRVPESVMAGGSRPGEIFVHRNIANQLHLHDDNALSALQYAVEHLDIHNVIVVGHTDCGGVAAAYDTATHPEPKPDPKQALTRWLKPLTKLAAALPTPRPPREVALHRLVEANVKAQVTNLASTKTIRDAWREYGTDERDAVWIHGWVYELESGRLKNLNITRGPPGAKRP